MNTSLEVPMTLTDKAQTARAAEDHLVRAFQFVILLGEYSTGQSILQSLQSVKNLQDRLLSDAKYETQSILNDCGSGI